MPLTKLWLLINTCAISTTERRKQEKWGNIYAINSYKRVYYYKNKKEILCRSLYLDPFSSKKERIALIRSSFDQYSVDNRECSCNPKLAQSPPRRISEALKNPLRDVTDRQITWVTSYF